MYNTLPRRSKAVTYPNRVRGHTVSHEDKGMSMTVNETTGCTRANAVPWFLVIRTAVACDMAVAQRRSIVSECHEHQTMTSTKADIASARFLFLMSFLFESLQMGKRAFCGLIIATSIYTVRVAKPNPLRGGIRILVL